MPYLSSGTAKSPAGPEFEHDVRPLCLALAALILTYLLAKSLESALITNPLTSIPRILFEWKFRGHQREKMEPKSFWLFLTLKKVCGQSWHAHSLVDGG